MTGLRCEWVAFALSMLDTYLQMQSTCKVAAEVALPSLFSASTLLPFQSSLCTSQRHKMLGYIVPNYILSPDLVADHSFSVSSKRFFGRTMFQ